MHDFPANPPERTIHERFGAALLESALTTRGLLHRDYRVHLKEEVVRVYSPRRSANDPAPPPKPHPDPAQNFLTAVTETAGIYAVDEKMGGYDIFIPLVFEPYPNPAVLPGLLGRVSSEPCCYTLHCVPARDRDFHDALHCSFNLWDEKYKDEKELDEEFFPKNWILGPETSEAARKKFGLIPHHQNFPGVYDNAVALGLQYISISELPITRETLVFRLLGTGAVLEAALEEQAKLPEDALERVATTTALRAVTTGAIPIDEAKLSPVLRACSKIYRRWVEQSEK